MQDFTILSGMEKMGVTKKAVCRRKDRTVTVNYTPSVVVVWDSESNSTKNFKASDYDGLIAKFKGAGYSLTHYKHQIN